MQSKDIKKYAGWALLAFGAYQVIKWLKSAAAFATVKVENSQVISQSGIDPQDVSKCRQAAQAAYDAIYNYFLGAFEDERGFIDALNMLSTSREAVACSMFYKAMPKGTSIKADMNKYLMSFEQSDIKPVIKSNII